VPDLPTGNVLFRELLERQLAAGLLIAGPLVLTQWRTSAAAAAESSFGLAESPWLSSPPPSRAPAERTSSGSFRAGGLGTPLGHQWRGWQGPGGQRENNDNSRMASACPTERPDSVFYEAGFSNSRPFTGREPPTPHSVNPMEEVGA
jgi:hypothetical protein